jgi:archaellum component FlaC
MKKKKSKAKKSGKKKVKTGNWLKQHKPLIIIALIVFLFLAAFGTKGFLYLNFILGNDIIIHLDADKEDLKLVRGEEESISFKASITTNPFCNAQCKSYFEDISRNNTIENNTFKLSPGMPITKEYKIKIDEFGEGQKLYRFGLECRGSANFLCHTKQESTSRNILVTVEHSLRDDERELKNSLKHDLNNLKQKIEGTATKANEIEIIINGLDNYVSINETKNNLNNLKKDTSVLVEELNLLAKIWDSQNYYELNKRFDEVDKKAVKTADMVAKIDKNVSDLLISYNSLAKELNDTRERLKEIKGIFILDKDIATEINDNINVFNSVVKSFNSRNGISKKRVEVNSINYSVYILYGKVKNYQKREYFEKAIEIDINYDILCSLNISCVNRPSINERANQTNFELKRACDGIENLRNL